MGRIRTRGLLILTALVALVAVLVPTVWMTRSASASHASSPSSVAITLSPSTGAVGESVLVTGSGYGHNQTISVSFDTTPVATATTTTSGTFTALFSVPQSAATGAHTVTATATKGKTSASATFQVISGADQWLQFGASSAGGRANLFDTTISSSNVAQLTQDWKTTLGGNISGFTVANGVVYTDDGTGVYALDPATGARLWYASTMGGGSQVSLSTTPAVDNGIVYAIGGDSHFYAFDAQTGATRWTFDTHSYALRSPTVVNGVVYFSTENSYIYALNDVTGAVIWSYLIPGGYYCADTLAVANGAVYFTTLDGVAFALDASTGAVKWQVTVGTSGGGIKMPIVDNGVVYMAAGAASGAPQGEIIALDTTSGATKWVANTSFYGVNGLALADGNIYASVIGDGVSGDGVYAFDEATGVLKWYDQVAMGESAPAVANGVVYVGASTTAYVYAFDAWTGAVLATPGICGTEPYTSPTVAQGVVYTGCGPQIVAYHLPGATP